jgi:hypothetical protein
MTYNRDIFTYFTRSLSFSLQSQKLISPPCNVKLHLHKKRVVRLTKPVNRALYAGLCDGRNGSYMPHAVTLHAMEETFRVQTDHCELID